MKKLIWSVSLLFFCALTLNSQSGFKPIVYSVTGKVKYADGPDAKAQKIVPGVELSRDGVLQIAPGATLGISYDSDYAVVNSAGEQAVATILNNVELFQISDVAQLLGDAIEEAINPYFLVRSGFAVAGDPPPPPPTKPEKDGHGNKDYKIVRLQPSGGKVSGNQPTFSWAMQDPGRKIKKFKFILRSNDNKVLWEDDVKGFEYELDPADFQMENGKYYKWQVISADDPEVSTPNIFFQYTASAELSQLRSSLRSAPMYQSADPAARMLLEATLLEQADFLSEAHELLRMAVRKNKKNQLAQLLYQSFEWRHDMIK